MTRAFRDFLEHLTDEQKEQIINDSIRVQNMQFKKFSSLDNTYRTNLIEKVVEEGIPTDDWIVTEKVDGANFSFWCDGQQVNVASRNQFVDGTFYGCQEVVDEIAPKILAFCSDNNTQIVIYGELYGDGIQKRVNYGKKSFVAFDVHCVSSGTPVDKEFAIDLCERIGILFAPVLFRGSFEECLAVTNTFKSLLTPEGYDGANIAEGVVIEPVNPAWFRNGSRVYFKNKSEKFSEKKEEHKVKVAQELSLSEASQSVLHNLTSYVTESRVVSVISKIGKVGTKDFQRILGLTVQDAIEDYEKDTEAGVKDVCGDEWKSVLKMLSGLSAHTVRSEFVKHID